MENQNQQSDKDQQSQQALEKAREAAPKTPDDLIETQKDAQTKPIETEFMADGSLSSET